MMLWCDSITPFGVPVEPEENMMVQRSSGVLLPPPASRSIHDTGSRRSARYQNTRSRLADALHEVLDEHHAGAFVELGLGEERPRRDDVRDAGLVDRRLHRLRPDGEVEVDRHLAGEQQAHVDQRRADRGRQQHADIAVVRRHRLVELARQQERAGQRLAEGRRSGRANPSSQKRRQECLACATKRRCTRSTFLRRWRKASPPISSSFCRTSQARARRRQRLRRR